MPKAFLILNCISSGSDAIEALVMAGSSEDAAAAIRAKFVPFVDNDHGADEAREGIARIEKEDLANLSIYRHGSFASRVGPFEKENGLNFRIIPIPIVIQAGS